MLNVSQAFKDAIQADSRNVKGAVIVSFDEKISLDQATATATSYASEATPPSQACVGRIREADYALTGMIPARLQGPHYGWQSAREILPDGTLYAPRGNTSQTLTSGDFQNGQLTDLEISGGALQLKSGSRVDDFTSPFSTFRVVSGNWGIDYLTQGQPVFTHPYISDMQSTTCVIEFDATDGPIMVFMDWHVSSENGYDIFTISIDGTNFVNASGERSGTISFFVESGTKQVTLKYSKDPSVSAGYDRAWLSRVEVRSATKISEMDFTTASTVSGFSNPNWALAYVSQAGKQVYRAETITHNQSTENIFTLTLDQEAVLYYKVGVSSERFYDWFNVYIDGQLWTSISGETVQASNATLQPGTHTIKFEYTKDENSTVGADTGWIEFIKVFTVNSTSVTQGSCILEVTTPAINGIVDEVRLSWDDTEDADFLVSIAVSFDDGQSWVHVGNGDPIPFDHSQPWPSTFKLKITLYNGAALWAPLEPGFIIPLAQPGKESTRLLSVSLDYNYSMWMPEELIIDYGNLVRSNNFLLVTSVTSVITDFKIEVYNPNTNQWVLLEYVTGNDLTEWAKYYPNTVTFQKIKLTVLKTKPGTSRITVLYFGAVAQLVFEGDDIVDFTVLEEMRAEGEAPLGSVTANECSLSLRNEHRWFTPQHKQSPLYGLLKPKTLFEPYLGVEVSPNTFEMVPMGKFRSTDWNAPSTSVEASVTGYDRLYELGDQDVPILPVQRNVQIKDLFALLFQALGLQPDEYEIDPTLTQPVQLGWIPNGKVFNALSVMSEAGNCSVTTDRQNRIVVRNNFQYVSEAPEVRFTDDDQILEIDNPQKLLDIYTHVKVNYKFPNLKPVQEILTVQDLDLPPGDTTLRNLSFRDAPVALVTSVQLLDAPNCKVTYFEYGAWSMNITINNASNTTLTTSLIVYGRPVELTNSAQTAINYEILARGVTEKVYSIDNPLIQNQHVAKVYSGAILDYLSDPLANYKITARGNPALELRDVIEVESAIDKIPLSRVSIMRSRFEFDGGLQVEMDAKKPMVPSFWICLAPGHMVKAYQKLENVYEQ
jgi:hypothetical protein